MSAAKRKWGQHWLASEDLAASLVASIGVVPGDRFVEIGPGTGRLTRPLLAAGAGVVAVEVDPECCAALEQIEAGGRLRVVEADVLGSADRIPWEEAPFRVVGNLPYNVSSPILRWTVEHRARFRDVHYMLQAEVAERIASPPGSRVYGLLSVIVQAAWRPEVLRRLPPGAFRPPPRVDSAFVRLTRRDDGPAGDLEAWIPAAEAAFGHRRKKLGNALRLAGFVAEAVDAACGAAGVDAADRAERLSPEDFARLGRELARR